MSQHGSSAYLDESGQPQLRHSLTAFLDILGFRQLIDDSHDLAAAQQMLGKIAGAIQDSLAFVNRTLGEQDRRQITQAAYKFFSDNLVFGFPCEGDAAALASALPFVIRCVQRYQLRMALNGFFVRGGLTCGPICLTDQIVFGAALIESYHLESRASIVPRVVLAKSLCQPVSDVLRMAQGNREDWICRDIDEWWFVNYLNATIQPDGIRWDYLARHKQMILDSLGATSRHDVLPKFGWLSRYHNVFCHWHQDDPGYRDEYRIHRVDEESVFERLSEYHGDTNSSPAPHEAARRNRESGGN